MISGGVGDDQVAVELLDHAGVATEIPPALRIDLLLDDRDDLLDQLLTAAPLGGLASVAEGDSSAAAAAEAATTAATAETTTTAAAAEAAAAATHAAATTTHAAAAATAAAADAEVRGVVEVGDVEDQVADVVDDRRDLLPQGAVGGDDHHAVLDRELGAVEVVADLLEDPLDRGVGGDLAELEGHRLVTADADRLERLPVGIDLHAGDLPEVGHHLVEVVVVEVDRDHPVEIRHDLAVRLGLAEAGGPVAADAQLRPVLRIGDERADRAGTGAGDVRAGGDARLERLATHLVDREGAPPREVRVLPIGLAGLDHVPKRQRRRVVGIEEENLVEHLERLAVLELELQLADPNETLVDQATPLVLFLPLDPDLGSLRIEALLVRLGADERVPALRDRAKRGVELGHHLLELGGREGLLHPLHVHLGLDEGDLGGPEVVAGERLVGTADHIEVLGAGALANHRPLLRGLLDSTKGGAPLAKSLRLEVREGPGLIDHGEGPPHPPHRLGIAGRVAKHHAPQVHGILEPPLPHRLGSGAAVGGHIGASRRRGGRGGGGRGCGGRSSRLGRWQRIVCRLRNRLVRGRKGLVRGGGRILGRRERLVRGVVEFRDLGGGRSDRRGEGVGEGRDAQDRTRGHRDEQATPISSVRWRRDRETRVGDPPSIKTAGTKPGGLFPNHSQLRGDELEARPERTDWRARADSPPAGGRVASVAETTSNPGTTQVFTSDSIRQRANATLGARWG